MLWQACAQAEAVWHCSRTRLEVASAEAAGDESADAEESFSAAFTSPFIGISLQDLLAVYSGSTVKVDGHRLTACYMLGRSALNKSAFDSLGLQTSVMQAFARKSTIVNSNLVRVTSEKGMAQCIAQNTPAVGYMSEATEDNTLGPCF